VCDWAGVDCDAGSVYYLNLDGNNLVGSLEIDLTALTNLQQVYLGNNALTGDFTTILSYLPTSLIDFDVYYNEITGTVPASVSIFTNLIYFNLGGNQLTGDLPTIIGYLPTGIAGLGLWGNGFTGTVPASISNFTGLIWLSLYDNPLTGDMSTIIGYIPTGIQQLYLFDSLYTGTIPDTISNLSSMIAFDVSNNTGMNGTISMNITTLALTWAKFGGTYLCEPADPGYDTWKLTVGTYSPGTCILFTDDFETGDFTLWTRFNDGGGWLYPCTDAAINETWGACVERGDNDKRKQFTDETPVDQTTFGAHFSFDINSLSLVEGERFRFMQVKWGVERPFFIVLKYESGQYLIQLNTLLDDLTKTKTGWYVLTDEPHTIEVNWQAASFDGANDGYAKLYIDDVLQEELIGLDNDTMFIEKFKVGFTSRLVGKSISGIFYVDDVATCSTGHIGQP
jgi:hypothetical protein